MMKSLRYFFLAVDTSFIVYWLITALQIIPVQYLYNDYRNEILVNWNWSFFPLDIAVSSTGFCSIYLHQKGNNKWKVFALISLILTSVSGLQAISYWALAKDFDPTWWLPNLFLLAYPLFFIPKFMKEL
ncbi:MAG: hypothetical protein EAZ08_13540 [Cytophagales bacterium]|nr:MAG: hypothetical protein EAZ08_13540 [Cytophagales bacterium]